MSTEEVASVNNVLERHQVPDVERDRLHDLSQQVLRDCPGRTEFRYISHLRQSRAAEDLAWFSDCYQQADGRAVLLTGLPVAADIEATKVCNLILGEAIGNCVAFSDYNHSYITDIRPTPLSKEKSAGRALLDMHNDLAWASDERRPWTLVLQPHVAEGDVPRTLLARTAEVWDGLAAASREVLVKPVFEARIGGALTWGHERIIRMPVATHAPDGRMRVKLNFSTFRPAASLDGAERQEAEAALADLNEVAGIVGTKFGHALRKGECLLIPNDQVVHGRDSMPAGRSERLLLRAYVLPREVAARHRSTMISLRS
jgi:hypothetical protein